MESEILDEKPLMPVPGSRTRQQYERTVKRLAGWYEEETGREWRDDPIAFVQFIVDYVNDSECTWSDGTWRSYRTALRKFLLRFGPVEAVRVLDDTRYPKSAERRSRRNADSFYVGVNKQDLEQVIEELVNNGRVISLISALWLITVRLTGMRPVECFGAYFSDDSTLMVPTAKRVEHGYHYYREMDVTEIVEKPPLGEAIALFLKELRLMVSECDVDPPCATVQQRCTMQIQRANRKLWPSNERTVTLRGARHQFSVDQQSMQDAIGEVSAALGHSRVVTTMRYYSSATPEDDWPRVQATERLLLQDNAVDEEDLDIDEDDELDDDD